MQVIIHNIPPFDATIGATIKFSWSGNQVFKNRCIIQTNDTQEVVYDNTITSFKLEHPIDLTKATLVNGKRYNAFITVFDVDDNESDVQSIGKQFICLKTPVFRFTNITEGQVLNTSTYTFDIEYSQENNELLDSWSISVYKNDKTETATSGVNYNTDNISYTFSGFTDKNEYFIRGIGKTVNGFSLDTGYIGISVSYTLKDVFSQLVLTNMPEIGAIHVYSNIVSSEGHLDKDGVYIENEYLDLRDNELTYSEGFVLDGDFSMVLLFYGMKPNSTVLTFHGENQEALTGNLIYRVIKTYGEDGSEKMKSCFELRVISNDMASVYYSNRIDMVSYTDKVGVCIVRKDERYDLQLTKLTSGQVNKWQDVAGMLWGDLEGRTWFEIHTGDLSEIKRSVSGTANGGGQ